MKEAFVPSLLLLAVILPLVLAVAMVPNSARATVLRLAPWAPLLALILAVFAPSPLTLPLP